MKNEALRSVKGETFFVPPTLVQRVKPGRSLFRSNKETSHQQSPSVAFVVGFVGRTTSCEMSDDLDFTTIDENGGGMSYEEILAAMEQESNKNAGKSQNYEEGAQDDKESSDSHGMGASSFDGQNARGDGTEFYESTTSGASMQAQRMQENSNNFSSTGKNLGGGKENSSSSANASKTGQPKDDHGKSNAANGSPADDITREAGIVLETKVQQVQEWCKKLLEEITTYVQVANKTNEEYLRIQQLEHQESERLDRVEPDVKGATSQLLGGFPFYGAAAQNQNANAATLGDNRVE